jgi:hypothetical protein
MNARNFCVFSWDGVFGNHKRSQERLWHEKLMIAQHKRLIIIQRNRLTIAQHIKLIATGQLKLTRIDPYGFTF